MSKETTYTGIIKNIINTSKTYITTGNVLNENYSIGIIVELEKGINVIVPLIKLEQIPNMEKMNEIKEKLKKVYGIVEDKKFTFNVPANKGFMDKVETTTYKQGVSGNVDNTELFINRTLYNNRIRKALIKNSKLILEKELEDKIPTYSLKINLQKK